MARRLTTHPHPLPSPPHPHRELSAKKQEAQALVSEMECTAQAFEEMQEQNIRLLMQLKVVGVWWEGGGGVLCIHS